VTSRYRRASWALMGYLRVLIKQPIRTIVKQRICEWRQKQVPIEVSIRFVPFALSVGNKGSTYTNLDPCL
jgi:hypothetical protein